MYRLRGDFELLVATPAKANEVGGDWIPRLHGQPGKRLAPEDYGFPVHLGLHELAVQMHGMRKFYTFYGGVAASATGLKGRPGECRVRICASLPCLSCLLTVL